MDYPEISKEYLPESVQEMIGDEEFVIESFIPEQDPVLDEVFGMDPVEREITKLQTQYEMRKMVDELNKLKTGSKKKDIRKTRSVIDELKRL